MSPMQLSADLLRRLDPRVRAVLYTALVLIGGALSALQALDIEPFGSLSVARALEIYAYIAPLTGLVAVANVTKPAAEPGGDLVEEPVDMSAFEPVGSIDEVFGASMA